MQVTKETATIKVRDWDGNPLNIECVKDEHPTPYGNGSCVRLSGHVIEWGHIFYDTRYLDFDAFGGFVGFCKEQLKAKGFEVIE